MKLKIKVKVLTNGCEPVISAKGDWIDLKSADNISIEHPWATDKEKAKDATTRYVKFSTVKIPLGVAMQLPDGFEAVVVPRSSTFKHWHLLQTNSMGVIDCSYRGDTDQWMMPVVALNDCTIQKFDRVCQFKIQLSQKATMWQKLKWLFSDGVEIEIVDSLNNTSRGGFGTTGKC